jgi:hypothetical protein
MLERGDYPVVGQGASLVEGRSDDASLLISDLDLPLLLLGPHTGVVKFVSFPFVPGPNVDMYQSGQDSIDLHFAAYLMETASRRIMGGRRYSRAFLAAKSESYPVPVLSEQHRIVAVLEQTDRAVDAAARHAADAQALLKAVIETAAAPSRASIEWERVALGDVAATPKIKPKPFVGNRRYFATGAVDRERLGNPVEVGFEQRPGRADCEPEIDDLGFARMKGARKFIRADDETATSLFSTGFSFWRAGDKVSPAYLYCAMRSEAFQLAKDSASSEGILGGATDRQIAQIPVWLPPLAEQQAIVARIETVEAAVRAAETHLAHLRALRSSLLENLVSGRVRLPSTETAGSEVTA